MAEARIGIDTRWLAGSLTGVGTYIQSLLRALPAVSKHRFTAFGTPPTGVPARVAKKPFTGYGQWGLENYWHLLPWPTIDRLAGGDIDLWHFPNYSTMPTRRPYVTTVHDLSFRQHPEFIAQKTLNRLNRYLPRTVEGARKVLAVSEYTKRSVVNAYDVSADDVVVTPLAADPRFSKTVPAKTRQRILKKHGLDKPYVLAVGTLEPRKNLSLLFRAAAVLGKQLEHPLVIAGGTGWHFAKTEQLLAELGLSDRVKFLGYVPEAELPSLYQGADCFVFPSKYEGFGIPVLEAMASGTPVITTNVTSLPEVAGDAALLVGPDDPNLLAVELRRVLRSSALRRDLRAAGRRRAKQFSWEQTARLTDEVYDEALR